MTKVDINNSVLTETRWTEKENSSHIVHFYPHDNALAKSLLEYISEGLVRGEVCIVVAAPQTLIPLNKALREKGIDVAEALNSNQYITYDAEELLTKFMDGNLPDPVKFVKTIGSIITLSIGSAKPVRAFGEMVTVLLRQGKLEGLIKLEQYWSKLIRERSFMLYCAYPETAFDSSKKTRELLNNICECHSMTISSELQNLSI